MMYKLRIDPDTNEINVNYVWHYKDGGEVWQIPNNPAISEWQEYQNWLALGNEPEVEE